MKLVALVEMILLLSTQSEKDLLLVKQFLSLCFYDCEPDWAAMENMDLVVCANCIKLYELLKDSENRDLFQSGDIREMLIKNNVLSSEVKSETKFITFMKKISFYRENNERIYVDSKGWTQKELVCLNSFYYIMLAIFIFVVFSLNLGFNSSLFLDLIPLYLFVGFTIWLLIDFKLSKKVHGDDKYLISLITGDNITPKFKITLERFLVIHNVIYEGDLLDIKHAISDDYEKLDKKINSLIEIDEEFHSEIAELTRLRDLVGEDHAIVQSLLNEHLK